MGLDRQDIERRDFPVGRRGYEPESVDAHLRRIADEVEEERRARRPSAASLGGAASEQVRAIVEAAEKAAGDIRRQAQADTDKARAEADEEARQQVARVREATQAMLSRVEAMESELGALLESLRTGADRVKADLTLLEDELDGLRSAARGPAPAAEAEEEAAAKLQEAGGPEPEPEAQATGTEPEEAEPAAEPAVEAPAGGDDSEGARLIALNMALNGTSREETDRYLAENFELNDRATLLDEVYARVG